MDDDILNENNFILFAAKHYYNPQCHDTSEFFDDLKRFKYLKRLFSKYEEHGELKERLILNHLIILYNVFGVSTTKMLLYKLEGHLVYLKPFLVLLGHMPDKIILSSGDITHSSDITMNSYIVDVLRRL